MSITDAPGRGNLAQASPDNLTTYTIARAAEVLGMIRDDGTPDVRAVRHLVDTGRIPFVKFGGRVRIRHVDLVDFVAANTRPAAGAALNPGEAFAEIVEALPPDAREAIAKGQVNARVVRRALGEAGLTISRSRFAALAKDAA